MTRKRFLGIALVLALLALLAVLILSRDPTYEGRTLRTSLRELAQDSDADDDTTAKRAIRHFGTNGLPILLAELRYKDSTPKRIVMKWNDWIGSKLESEPFKFTPAWKRRATAASALRLLGPDATSAIPALTENLSDSDLSFEAAWVLAGIGEPARSILLQNTASTNWIVRHSCAHALRFFTNDSQVVFTLQSLCTDPQPEVRSSAARGLGILQAAPETTVPILITLLDDPGFNIQIIACRAVARFGSNATPALPKLVQLLKNHQLTSSVGAIFRSVDPAGRPMLLELLSHEEAPLRIAGVRIFAQLEGTNISSTTALIPLLRDSSLEVRCVVASAVADAPAIPDIWLQPFIEALTTESNSIVRLHICEALQQFGNAARPALPVLSKLIPTAKRHERETLLITVATIDPDTAKSLGASQEILESAKWLKDGPPGPLALPLEP